MPALPDRLSLLQRHGPAAAAPTLIAALVHAEPDELLPIARTLVRTGRTEAVAAVIGHLHRLGPAGFELLEDQPHGLAAALTRLTSGRWPRATANAVDVIERQGDPRHLACLRPLLDDASATLAARAADLHLRITVATVGWNGRRRATPDREAALDQAVAAAAALYPRHRLQPVMVAAAVLARRPGPRLAALLADDDHPAALGLRGAVERVELPVVRRNLVGWLGTEALRRSAGRWLHRVGGRGGAAADVLGEGHLLLHPARMAGLRRVDRPARCLPDDETLAALDPSGQARMARLVRGLDLRPVNRTAFLRRLVRAAGPRGRLEAALALAGSADPDARDLLGDLATDDDPHVAQVAFIENGPARAGETPAPRWLEDLERRAGPAVAGRAAVRLAAADADRFLARWHHLAPAARVAAAFAVAAADRGGFVRRLGERIADGGRADALAAIDVARRLRAVADLEPELLAVARAGSDPRVAATAVTALGELEGEAVTTVLQAGLTHRDPRVRANAVESLVRGRGPGLALGLTRVESRNNRARANAIRARLRVHPEAGLENLRSMLTDHDPLHRVSAVWVARRARARAAARQLERLVTGDRLPEIRTRAAAALGLLDARRLARRKGGRGLLSIRRRTLRKAMAR
ncbi:MAG: HEAT repeat domain-containing protein [Planctomycetota bacterium]|jgi:hypothetical protein